MILGELSGMGKRRLPVQKRIMLYRL